MQTFCMIEINDKIHIVKINENKRLNILFYLYFAIIIAFQNFQ